MVAAYDPELIDNFEASSCLQSREFRNSVIFHGALHGNDKCRINRRHAVEDGDLYDIYEAFVGYDDLYSYVDDQYVASSNQDQTFPRGHHASSHLGS